MSHWASCLPLVIAQGATLRLASGARRLKPFSGEPWRDIENRALQSRRIARSDRQDATVLRPKPPAKRSPRRSPMGKPDVGEQEGKGVWHGILLNCAWPGSGAAGVQRQLASSRVAG